MSSDASHGTSAGIDAYVNPERHATAGDSGGLFHNSTSPTSPEFNTIYRAMTGQHAAGSLGDRIDQVLSTGYRGPIETPKSTEDVRANVFAILDRVSATTNDGRTTERSFAMPSRDDLLNKPISELRSQLDTNTDNLKQTIDPNLPQLQENFLGFHGTTPGAMKGIMQAGDQGRTLSLYVATSGERSADSLEWMANTSQSLTRATQYATDQRGTPVEGGKIAIVDMGQGGRAGQNFGVALDSPTDTNFMGTAAKAGQTIETFNAATENKIKGWIDPSDWSQFQGGVKPADGTAETFDRNRLAEGFARQAMVKALLETLGYHVGRQVTATDNADGNHNDDGDDGFQREKQVVTEETKAPEESPSRTLQPTTAMEPKASSSINDYVRVKRDGTPVLTTEQDMARVLQQIQQIERER